MQNPSTQPGMALLDFLIPRRRLSVQAKSGNLQRWKSYVHEAAKKWWPYGSTLSMSFHLTLVYLCNQDPVDTDNIIKPIQDALNGLVYDDDSDVTDVECHRRPLSGTFDVGRYPKPLLQGVNSGTECVYVRVSQAEPLENYL